MTPGNRIIKFFLGLLYLTCPAILIFAPFYEGEYSYYEILRVYTFLFSGYFAWMTATNQDGSFADKGSKYPILFIGIMIIFNPIIPIHLSKEVWAPIDILAGLALIFYFIERKVKHRKIEQDEEEQIELNRRIYEEYLRRQKELQRRKELEEELTKPPVVRQIQYGREGVCLHCGKKVTFELDEKEEICPECGWSQAYCNERKVAQSAENPYLDSAKTAGILMIVLGIIELVVILGIKDIYIGTKLKNMKGSRYLEDAKNHQIFKIVLYIIIFIIVILLYQTNIKGILIFDIPILVLGCFNQIVLSYLRKPSVTKAFENLPV